MKQLTENIYILIVYGNVTHIISQTLFLPSLLSNKCIYVVAPWHFFFYPFAQFSFFVRLPYQNKIKKKNKTKTQWAGEGGTWRLAKFSTQVWQCHIAPRATPQNVWLHSHGSTSLCTVAVQGLAKTTLLCCSSDVHSASQQSHLRTTKEAVPSFLWRPKSWRFSRAHWPNIHGRMHLWRIQPHWLWTCFASSQSVVCTSAWRPICELAGSIPARKYWCCLNSTRDHRSLGQQSEAPLPPC